MRPQRERARELIQRACGRCGATGCTDCAGAQRSPRGEAPQSVPPTAYEALRQPGDPLEDGVRRDHERALGHDLSSIRIHDDRVAGTAAREMNAHAFTFGQHIVLADDAPVLGIAGGRDLLRHELTHAIEHQPRWDPRSDGVGMLSIQATDSADERDAAATGDYAGGTDELDADESGAMATDETADRLIAESDVAAGPHEPVVTAQEETTAAALDEERAAVVDDAGAAGSATPAGTDLGVVP